MAKGMQVVQLTKQREVCEMQKAEVVLTVLRKKSMQDKDFVFDRLYRNLFNPDFYMLAYSNMYAKEGTLGVTITSLVLDAGYASKETSLLLQTAKNSAAFCFVCRQRKATHSKRCTGR
jgi:hypothetical protein